MADVDQVGTQQRAQLGTIALALSAALAFAAPAAGSAGPRTVTGLLSSTAVERGVLPSNGLAQRATAGGDRFTVTTDAGRLVNVSPQPAALIGRRVTISDTAARPGIQGAARALATRAALNATKLGPRTVAVVRVNFTDNRSDPGSVAAIQSAFSTDPASVNAFYGAQSGGTVSFTGRSSSTVDVFGIYQLGMASAGCNTTQMANLANSAAAAAGVQLAAYDHVVLLFPHTAACWWAGLGQEPGRVVWSNGSVAVGVFAHELGHNLGANHAASLACTDASGAPVALSSTCTETEYGDPYDVMGDSWAGPRLMSSWHRAQIGELPVAEQVTASTGTLTLTDANAAGATGTRLILVPRAAAGQPATQYFALEIRGGLPLFDVWNAFYPQAAGVTVRLVPQLSVVGFSDLLDMHPGGSLIDAPLSSGESFVDPLSGVVISDLSSAAGTAQVQINGTPLVATTPPSRTPVSTLPVATSPVTTPVTTPVSRVPVPPTVRLPPVVAIRVLLPAMVSGRATLLPTRQFVAGAGGAARVTIRVNGGRPYVARTAWGRVTLSARQSRRARIVVSASGGTLAGPLQDVYLVQRRVITQH